MISNMADNAILHVIDNMIQHCCLSVIYWVAISWGAMSFLVRQIGCNGLLNTPIVDSTF